jgi:hypothetical protein
MKFNLVSRILIVIVGAILLLPGLCAVVFAISMNTGSWPELLPYGMLWAVCLLVSFGGVMLIRIAFK